MMENNNGLETYVVRAIDSTVYVPCVVTSIDIARNSNGTSKVKYTVIPKYPHLNLDGNSSCSVDMYNLRVSNLDIDNLLVPDSFAELISNEALIKELERRKEKGFLE